jgi:hypothetical protein
MELLARYWVEGPSGDPVEVRYPVGMNPYEWPTHNRYTLVHLLVEMDEDTLNWLVEYAAECGWAFNRITKTFYRLD